MDRYFKSGAAGAAPALDNASNGYATNGNPGGGVPATVPGAHWYHMITEELLAVIADAAIAFDKTNVTQVRDAIRALVAGAALPRSYLSGYGIVNNAGDATNDWDIAIGIARSSDDTTNLLGGAMTKQLDAVWAGGTNQGGRCSGEALADGTWHIQAFKRTTGGGGVDYCYTQLTNPTLPDSATKSRRIASFIRAAGAIVPLSVRGNEFLLNVPFREIENLADHTVAQTLTLARVPTGYKFRALVRVTADDNGAADGGTFVSPLDIANTAPSITATGYDAQGRNATVRKSGPPFYVRTNASAQIRYRANDALIDTQIFTLGWEDTRGRDD